MMTNNSFPRSADCHPVFTLLMSRKSKPDNEQVEEVWLMKKHTHWIAATVAGLSLSGCMSPNGRPDYTGSGALAGGATGAIIGSMARNHAAGAAIGAATGALVGGLIGHGMDQAQEAQLQAQAPQTLQRIEQGDPLTVLDVQALVQAGISDDLIINQIRNSRTVYHLSTADIISLKNTGASDVIIDFMINTPTQIQSATVAGESGRVAPAPLCEPVAMCPGPGYVWVSGAWLWLGDHWGWRKGYWHRPSGPVPGPRFRP
jgi:outer membrane lipoprotein SlyB